MDKAEVVERVRVFARLVNAELRIRQAILFGSWAKNMNTEESDIDVAIIVDRSPDDLLTTMATLCRLRRQVDIRIEPVLLERTADRSGFIATVQREGQVVFDIERQVA